MTAWSDSKEKPHRVIWIINKRFFGRKFHIFHGAFAWEVQIGTHVFQWFYSKPHIEKLDGKKFRHWIDEFGGKH